jgi:hypothetical protein
MTGTPTFATITGFLGIARDDPTAAFVVAGVPLDIGTTNRAGARDGPHATRHASRMLIDGEHPEFWVKPGALNVATPTTSGPVTYFAPNMYAISLTPFCGASCSWPFKRPPMMLPPSVNPP